MAQTIWKFELDLRDEQVILVPRQFAPLAAQWQRGILCVWAIVDPDSPHDARHFFIVGTGHPLPTIPVTYISTVQQGPLVWHVFYGRAR